MQSLKCYQVYNVRENRYVVVYCLASMAGRCKALFEDVKLSGGYHYAKFYEISLKKRKQNLFSLNEIRGA